MHQELLCHACVTARMLHSQAVYMLGLHCGRPHAPRCSDRVTALMSQGPRQQKLRSRVQVQVQAQAGVKEADSRTRGRPSGAGPSGAAIWVARQPRAKS